MTDEEKEKILTDWQNRINALPYASTIPYPYCCLCFERLTVETVTTDGDEIVNVCKDCKEQEDARMVQKVAKEVIKKYKDPIKNLADK